MEETTGPRSGRQRIMASEVTKHHEMAPSSAPAIMQCACFESGGDREINPFDDYASLGTDLHDYTEALQVDKEPPEIETLTDEHKEKCEFAAAETKSFLKSIYPSAKFEVERHVKILDIYGKVISEGTQDNFAYPDVGGDLKSGLDYKPYLHDYKPQQCFYSYGNMLEFKIDKMAWFEMYIMPGVLKQYELTNEECVATIRTVFQRKYSKYKKPQICYFCRMCSNILYCSAVNKSMKMIGDLYKDIPKPENVNKVGEIVDGKEMSQVLVFAKDVCKPYVARISKIVKLIEGAALALSESGVPIPYFKRVGKAKSFIEDFDEAFRLVPELTKEEFKKAMKLSMPQLAEQHYKKLKAVDSKMTKKSARNELEARLIHIIQTDEIKYSLERKMVA